MKRQPPQPYSIGIESIARKAQFYSGGRVWAEPTKSRLRDVFILVRKNQVTMYKESPSGYTINRKNFRQQEIHGIDSKKLHIELLPGKPKFL